MADEVGGELERLFKQSRWQGNDDLVLAHPASGEPLYKPGVLRRMRKALKAAKLDESHRFHDVRHTSGPGWPRPGSRCGHCRSGWDTATFATTQRYADYAPSAREAEMVAAAFARDTNASTNLREPDTISGQGNRSTEPNLT